MQLKTSLQVLGLLLLLEIAVCRVITKTNHREIITDENGDKQYKMWTTTDDDSSSNNGDDNYFGNEHSEFGFPRTNPHKDTKLLEAVLSKGMDPVAVAELLKTKEPVVRTTQTAEGHKQTTTYRLEPDGSISSKTLTIKPVVYDRGYITLEDLLKNDGHIAGVGKVPIEALMQTNDEPLRTTQRRPDGGVTSFTLRRRLPTKQPHNKPGNTYIFNTHNITPDPNLIKPISGPPKDWEWLPARLPAPVPYIERELLPPLPPLPPLAPFETLEEVSTTTTTTPQSLPAAAAADEVPIDSGEVWPEFDEIFGANEKPKGDAKLPESWDPKNWQNSTLGKKSNGMDLSTTTTTTTTTKPTQPNPELDHLVRSLFEGTTLRPQTTTTATTITTSTAKVSRNANDKTIEIGNEKEHVLNKDTSTLLPSASSNVERTVNTNTYTKTFSSPNMPTAADLDPDMQQILQKAGILLDEFKPTNNVNAQSVTKTRVEPDGKRITTTFRIHTVPSYTAPNPINVAEPANTANTNQIFLSPPSGAVPTKIFTTALNPANPFLWPQPQNPITAYLSSCGVSVADMEASKGELVKTIADAEGRVLTVRFLLSSIQNEKENWDRENSELKPKPIK